VNLMTNDDKQPTESTRFFYVSCIDGHRKALVSGPYASHAEALDAVQRVQRAAEKIDPRAIWYAWGTSGSETYDKPGALGKL
jgi:hypothetical protein